MKKRAKRLKIEGFFLFWFVLSLTSCGLMGREIRPMEGTASGILEEADYRITMKDVLEIKVYPDEQLSRELTVSPSGTINFPLIGEVQAEGLTPTALERKLTALLEKDYLVYPQVQVKVKEYRALSVYLLGEVNRPGPYKLASEEGSTTLLEAIAQGGGFSPVANIKKIKIIRTEGTQKKTYYVNGEDVIKGKAKDVVLRANDIIVVEQSWF